MRAPGVILLLLAACGGTARAALPEGYLVWSHGDLYDRASRRCWRMTLPEMTDARALTTGTGGEDVECQASPDGKWVAFARAKLPGMDYHQFNNWRLYIVSIHGVDDCRTEIKIDDDGYWPSWGGDGSLFYAQVDDDGEGEHTRIMRAVLDEQGRVTDRTEFFSTREAFAEVPKINETFVAPDGSWFAARTRGGGALTGVAAFGIDPPLAELLARAGDVGCMPYVSPDGTWGLAAGRDHGIRWGQTPGSADRVQDQELIPPRGPDDLCYHPGFSTDGRYVLAAHSTDSDHNAGAYEIYAYELDPDSMTVDAGTRLTDGGFNGWPHIWVGVPGPPPPPVPRIDTFRPDSWTLVAGEEVELSWSTRCAESAALDGQPVPLEGSRVDTPAATTTYTLEASRSGTGETATAQVEVTVHPTPRPVEIESFSVEPAAITAGDVAVLSWTVRNPTTLDINGREVAPADSMEVMPLQTTGYTLTARGHQGPAERTLTIEVEKLRIGLPDRGGCFCESAAPAGAALLVVLGLALLAARRRRPG